MPTMLLYKRPGQLGVGRVRSLWGEEELPGGKTPWPRVYMDELTGPASAVQGSGTSRIRERARGR